MSVQALSWALHESPVRNKGDLLVLIALADSAHQDGDGAYPSVAILARVARMSSRSVQESLRRLESTGIIEGAPRHGKTTVYRVPITPAKSVEVQTSQGCDPPQGRGAKSRANPCEPSHPNRLNRQITGEDASHSLDALVVVE